LWRIECEWTNRLSEDSWLDSEADVVLSPSLQRPTLVLNRNWQPINVATVARALIMLWNDSAKIVDPVDYQLYDWSDWSRMVPDRDEPFIQSVPLRTPYQNGIVNHKPLIPSHLSKGSLGEGPISGSVRRGWSRWIAVIQISRATFSVPLIASTREGDATCRDSVDVPLMAASGKTHMPARDPFPGTAPVLVGRPHSTRSWPG
jgi:hypothetical protein